MKTETKALLAAVVLIASFTAGVVVGQQTAAAQRASAARRNWCDGFEAAQTMVPGATGKFLGYGCLEAER